MDYVSTICWDEINNAPPIRHCVIRASCVLRAVQLLCYTYLCIFCRWKPVGIPMSRNTGRILVDWRKFPRIRRCQLHTRPHLLFFPREKKKETNKGSWQSTFVWWWWAMNNNLLNIYIFIHGRGFNFLLAPYGPNVVDFSLYGRRRRRKKNGRKQ